MPDPWRQLSVTALLIAVGAVPIYFGEDLASWREQRVGELACEQCQLDDLGPTDEELERRRQSLLRRILAKELAVRELLVGRLTLPQAAARFRDAEAAVPPEWCPPRPGRGGPAEAERLCRDVITWAHGWLEENLPAQATAVAARLERELQQHRAEDGVIHLSD